MFVACNLNHVRDCLCDSDAIAEDASGLVNWGNEIPGATSLSLKT